MRRDALRMRLCARVRRERCRHYVARRRGLVPDHRVPAAADDHGRDRHRRDLRGHGRPAETGGATAEERAERARYGYGRERLPAAALRPLAARDAPAVLALA